ncbi:MAG: hypothetical protein J7M14_01635, partial [Planctomycetes bacterium]|nr:hypothetical protein [Planctomycetota bacterium]
MKVELHLHTSAGSVCAVNTPSEMLEALVESHYEAVYITEHDALWEAGELDELRRDFPQLRIFPGIERTLGSHHLLILGASNPEYLATEDISEVLDLARGEGHLTVLAHP